MHFYVFLVYFDTEAWSGGVNLGVIRFFAMLFFRSFLLILATYCTNLLSVSFKSLCHWNSITVREDLFSSYI